MLEIKFVRDHLDDIETMLLNRRSTADLSQFKAADDKRREILFKIEDLRHRRNVVSDQIAEMKKMGQNADALVADMRNVAKEIKALETPLSENEEQTRDILMQIPNLPHASVPVGNDSSENPIIKTVGNRPNFEFEPKPHWTLGDQLGILDLDRATKITGTRFPLYYGAGARLERALINFMLDMHTHEHGYMEVLPPFIVNAASMTNTGQLPKFKEDLFKIEEWPYYLVPTAEVPVTNIHQGEILDESDLPLLYAAHTPCFRSEAGSYGKDTRGLIRQHQFNKVELVKFTTPENSYAELESLLHNAEAILSSLDLPY
jgi:seryl-tRNA synthetase